MLCDNCGKENADESRFCEFCGKPLENAQTNELKQEEQVTINQEEAPKVEANPAIEKIKKLPKKILFGGIAGIVAIIAIICFVVNMGATIDLNKYVVVEATGYNGYGHANISLDWDAIEQKYGKKISFTKKVKNEYKQILDLISPIDALKEAVDVSLDTRDKLSNGDKITYTWDIEEELSQYLNCKVKYKDSTYEVSGLQDVATFDAFSDLAVSFEGTSPYGNVIYEYTGSDLEYYDFECENASGLKNGDIVTIYINSDNIEFYAENIGKVPSELEKEYTVEGLDEYVEAYSDMSAEFVDELKNETEDTIYAYTANSYSEESSLEDLTYAGYILNQVIDGDEYTSTYNNLYIIYSGIVSNSEGKFPDTTVYYPVRFTNILKTGDDFSFGAIEGIVGSSSLGNYWYSTKGYISPLECYIDIVEYNEDSYSSEMGDGFEVYSQYEVVSSLNDITETYKASTQANTEKFIKNYIKNDYSDESKAKDLTYVGDYLLISKNEDTDLDERNVYVVVYSATVTNQDDRFEKTTVYFPVEYTGIVKLPGDEYLISSSNGIQGNSYFPDSYYSTSGYVDGKEMYTDIITANRESYKYEITEGLQQFGH